MLNRIRSLLWYLIPAISILLIFCGEIPDDPTDNPDLASVELLTQSIAGKTVNAGDCIELGLFLEYSNYFDSIIVYTSCDSYDTAIHILSGTIRDTCTITPCFLQAGACTLYVCAVMINPRWKDYETSLPLVIHSTGDTAEPGDSTGDFVTELSPAYTYVPEHIVMGQPDTLLFALDNTDYDTTMTIALVDPDVADNGVGVVTSQTVSIAVKQKVVITKNPEPQQVKQGESAAFSVTAVGDPPLSYLWMKDGAILTDQTASTSRIDIVTPEYAGTYTCKVSNGFSEVVSTGAKLLVTPRYRVTYNGNGAGDNDVPVDNNWYESGEKAIVLGKPVGLRKEGFEFGGWCYDINGDGTIYEDGDVISIGSSGVKLYAVWKLKCTITFDVNGGKSEPDPLIVNQGSSLGNRLPSVEKTSYVFDGWKNTQGNIITGTTPIQGDMTIYAQWIVKDVDGNIYTEVKIGNQVWMVENLKTTKYNDGTSIPNITDAEEWGELESPGYCWQNNDISNKEPYGALYNWYTANMEKLAPDGWHVASDEEWTILEEYLIANGYNYDGTKEEAKIAKALASTTDWNTTTVVGAIGNNLSKNNISGFSGFPGGFRTNDGTFFSIGSYSIWSTPIRKKLMSITIIIFRNV